ncbi:MAG: Scr1 family TA system antitoxin-like transcriptional regulator [Pseudonocardiaceae bacterium]
MSAHCGPRDGPNAALVGGFYVLRFASVRPIAYTELIDGGAYVQDPDQVHTHAMTAENVKRVALQPDESLALIRLLTNATQPAAVCQRGHRCSSQDSRPAPSRPTASCWPPRPAGRA